MRSPTAATDEKSPRLIAQERLENGIELLFQDLSRKIAGDRWNVRLLAEARIPSALCMAVLQGELAKEMALNDVPVEWLADGVTVSFHKERHFVAAQEVTATLRACEEELRESVLPYVRARAFAGRAVARHCRERAEQQRLAALVAAQPNEPLDETDAGPTDFSACFRT